MHRYFRGPKLFNRLLHLSVRGAANRIDQPLGVSEKSKKTAPSKFELCFLFGKLYVPGVSEVHQSFFERKFDSDMQFGYGTQNLMHNFGL